MLAALYFIVLEFLIVCALALFFSSFSTPLMSAVFAFASVHHWKPGGRFAGICPHHPWLRGRAGDGHRVPGAEFFRANVITQAAHGDPVPGRLIFYNSVYALLYSAMTISAAVLIFQRRNLK